jgi:hypothetical protein
LLVLGLLALAGCPDGGSGLPKQLWLATFQSEANVQLEDHEPPPF